MKLTEIVYREKTRTKRLQNKMRKMKKTDSEHTLVARKKSSGGMEFYLQQKGTNRRTYINRKNQGIIRDMLRDRFVSDSLSILDNNEKALDAFLDSYQEYDPTLVMDQLPPTFRRAREFCEKQGLLSFDSEKKPRFKGSEKPAYKEELNQPTSFGLVVRSKGEAMIAEALFNYTDVEFYYEKRLTLKNEFGQEVEVYPDFTIPRKLEGDLYWEHKGMMSDANYNRLDQRKMDLYFRNDIYAPKNLIITCDGPNGSTDIPSILQLVRGYLGVSEKTM